MCETDLDWNVINLSFVMSVEAELCADELHPFQ